MWGILLNYCIDEVKNTLLSNLFGIDFSAHELHYPAVNRYKDMQLVLSSLGD